MGSISLCSGLLAMAWPGLETAEEGMLAGTWTDCSEQGHP